jgi:hypothetical protein
MMRKLKMNMMQFGKCISKLSQQEILLFITPILQNKICKKYGLHLICIPTYTKTKKVKYLAHT